jgi:heavy metal sensor kinase
MNTRSLKFQLIVWYAGLLLGCFMLLGGAAYLALQNYLVGSLKDSQFRRGRQIAQLVLEESRRQHIENVGAEVETRYAPGINERFVRILSDDGMMVYESKLPASLDFLPSMQALPTWPASAESTRRVPLANGREMMVASQVAQVPGGHRFLIETGAPLDEVRNDLRQWLILLLIGLPVVAGIAVGGGYFLIKRALTPVDRIAASAERIGSHNLTERLPVAKTGDELERLSTTLNNMIQRLEEAFLHSRRFMADASHELRTPLTVLRGELESLVHEKNPAAGLQERLGSALEEVERLVNIVEGLFAISRLDAGEAQAEWVQFDLAALAAATADQMALLGEDKNIKVSCSPADHVWVAGDRARMKQVVVNLLDNAIKFTPSGGTVDLNVRRHDSKAVLEVADNGMGIPPEALPRIFERFYRVDPARQRDLGGAGLGLSIVKSICLAHQGGVEAVSTPGRGSVFRVELPLALTPTNNGQHKLHEP